MVHKVLIFTQIQMGMAHTLQAQWQAEHKAGPEMHKFIVSQQTLMVLLTDTQQARWHTYSTVKGNNRPNSGKYELKITYSTFPIFLQQHHDTQQCSIIHDKNLWYDTPKNMARRCRLYVLTNKRVYDSTETGWNSGYWYFYDSGNDMGYGANEKIYKEDASAYNPAVHGTGSRSPIAGAPPSGSFGNYIYFQPTNNGQSPSNAWIESGTTTRHDIEPTHDLLPDRFFNYVHPTTWASVQQSLRITKWTTNCYTGYYLINYKVHHGIFRLQVHGMLCG